MTHFDNNNLLKSVLELESGYSVNATLSGPIAYRILFSTS